MTIPMMAVIDLAPVGEKINDLIRLTGVVIEITIEEKNRRDFLSGLSKMEQGIENLRRLPGTAYAVKALSQELEGVRRITDYGDGAKAIQKLLGKLKDAWKLADGARKEEQKKAIQKAASRRKAMVDEIAYQAVREEVQARLVRLDSEPLVRGVDDFGGRIDEARLARDAADQVLASGESGDALVAIRQVLKDCDGIVRDWEKRIKKAKGSTSYSKLLKKANTAHQELSSSEVLSPDEKEQLQTTLRQLMSPLLGDKKLEKEEVEAIGTDLDTLHREGQDLIRTGTQRREETASFIGPIVKKTRDLLVVALGRELSEELLLAREAEKLLEQREHVKARERAQTLKDGHAALEERLTTAYGDWTRATKDALPKLTEAIGQQRTHAEESGFLFRHDPSGLMSARFSLEEGLMTTRSYTEANTALRTLATLVEANAAQQKGWTDIAEHRLTEQARVKEARTSAEEALRSLSAAMVQAMKQQDPPPPEDWSPHDVGGLAATLQKAISDWEALCKTASSAEELSAEGTILLLHGIAEEATQALEGDGAGVAALVGADLKNAAMARYQKAERQVSDKLPEWLLYPIPHAAEIRTSLEVAQAAIGHADTVEEIHSLAEALEQKHRLGLGEGALVDGLLEVARRGLADRVKEARAAAALARKAAEKKGLLTSSEVTKLRERCLLELQRIEEQIETIAGRHTSDVLDVFHEGTRILSGIQGRCVQIGAMCQSGKETDLVLPETFEALLKACKVRLGSKDLKKYRPSELYLLTQKLEGIADRLEKNEHTTRIDASLQEWDQAFEEAMVLVRRDIQEKSAFDQLWEVVSGMLSSNETLFKGYEAFYKKLQGSLKGAQQQSEAEDGIRAADTTLRVAKAELERVIMASTEEGRGRGLVLDQELRQGQSAAMAGKEREKDQKKAWEARVKVFEERWLPKLPSGADEVKQLLQIAQKSAKQKPPDYDAASRYLQMAADRAQLAIQFPEGPVSVSLSRLPGEAKKWGQAVAQFRSSLSDLHQHFGLQQDPAKKALQGGLAELGLQFDPTVFVPIVQRICAKGTDDDTRAQQREAGLAQIRQYRDVMIKDARFRLLQKHPFQGVPAWKGHLILQRPLIELERLLLMAVPTS